MNMVKQERLAENLERVMNEGGTIKDAFLDAGYSQSMAETGLTAVPDRVFKLMGANGSRLAQLGNKLSLDDCKALVLGRLAENCERGKDGGVMSAKVLGSRKELNLWANESQVGVIVLNSPQIIENKGNDLLAEPEE